MYKGNDFVYSFYYHFSIFRGSSNFSKWLILTRDIQKPFLYGVTFFPLYLFFDIEKLGEEKEVHTVWHLLSDTVICREWWSRAWSGWEWWGFHNLLEGWPRSWLETAKRVDGQFWNHSNMCFPSSYSVTAPTFPSVCSLFIYSLIRKWFCSKFKVF